MGSHARHALLVVNDVSIQLLVVDALMGRYYLYIQRFYISKGTCQRCVDTICQCSIRDLVEEYGNGGIRLLMIMMAYII